MLFDAKNEIEQKKTLVVYSLFFILGFVVALAFFLFAQVGEARCERKMRETDYKYISTVIPCDVDDQISSRYNVELKSRVQDYIDEAKTRKITKHVSVYYYDFRHGSWFGINENEKFYPSSLLKIPILMATLQESEKSFDYLFQKVIYNGIDTGLIQYYKPKEKLEVGKTYTIGELAEYTIKYSNNEAAFLLSDILGDKKLKAVYDDIGIPLPGPEGVNFITVREYVTLYKVLFNGSYLSHRSSEAILSLLANTTFKDGLEAGVPNNVVVAHKFGERTDERIEGLQLHDCGIVYVPNDPYILCVMTQGNKFEDLSAIIKNISKIVYEEVIHH